MRRLHAWWRRRFIAQYADAVRHMVWSDGLRDPTMPIPYWPVDEA